MAKGYVRVSKHKVTGEIQHSPIYRTPSEAIKSVPKKRGPWTTLEVVEVRTEWDD